MQLWQAVVLGIVEGITEYLPVSSTAHLLVTQRLLGIVQDDASNAYVVAIQGGAILAVVVVYRRRLLQIVSGMLGRDAAGARLALSIVLAFVPAAIAGLAFDDLLERYLFGPLPIAAAWAVGGLLILAISSRPSSGGASLDGLSRRAAVIIGVCQCAALWPGVSRSLATIVAGTMVGLSLNAAVEFSFLLGLVTLTAASSYALVKGGPAMLNAYGAAELAAGFLMAWLAAMLSVYWMVDWLRRRPLTVFGWWRLIAAVILVGLVLTHRI